MSSQVRFSARTRIAVLIVGAMALTACAEGGGLGGFRLPFGGGGSDEAAAGAAGDAVARDVEAPEVFQQSDQGLWDGRPSLGGIWVAHADVTDPERAKILNTANGQSIVGALFRREATAPGPAFQVSSDAAEALGMLAGQPADLRVTALRTREVPAEPAPEAATAAPGVIAESTLEDPATAEVIPAAATQAPPPAPTQTAAVTSSLSKPFIQVAIFRDRSNAERAADGLRSAGVVPLVRERRRSSGSAFRVMVGPAPNEADRAAMLTKVKALGYSDAYFVSE